MSDWLDFLFFIAFVVIGLAAVALTIYGIAVGEWAAAATGGMSATACALNAWVAVN